MAYADKMSVNDFAKVFRAQFQKPQLNAHLKSTYMFNNDGFLVEFRYSEEPIAPRVPNTFEDMKKMLDIFVRAIMQSLHRSFVNAVLKEGSAPICLLLESCNDYHNLMHEKFHEWFVPTDDVRTSLEEELNASIEAYPDLENSSCQSNILLVLLSSKPPTTNSRRKQ